MIVYILMFFSILAFMYALRKLPESFLQVQLVHVGGSQYEFKYTSSVAGTASIIEWPTGFNSANFTIGSQSNSSVGNQWTTTVYFTQSQSPSYVVVKITAGSRSGHVTVDDPMCIEANVFVLTERGAIRAWQVTLDDKLLQEDGSSSQVKEITKSYTRQPLWKNGDVLVTSFHPLRYNGKYIIAKDHPEMTEVENKGAFVYNFRLESEYHDILFESHLIAESLNDLPHGVSLR